MGAPYYMHGIRQLPLCSFFLRLLLEEEYLTRKLVEGVASQCSSLVLLAAVICCLKASAIPAQGMETRTRIRSNLSASPVVVDVLSCVLTQLFY